MINNTPMLTTTRSPFDHILSGAIAGIIGGAALNLAKFKDEKADKNEFIKQTAKFAISGGIVSGTAIYCANRIVKGKYLSAAVAATAAVITLNAVENLIKTKDKK
ncbi:MAG: hypothetical protein IJ211_03630 [Campylobacter sp.]|nr:hypothetical protein [Campylobacter sp.]